MKERNTTIDIAKAIAIWMVVTAHLIRKGPVTDYLAAMAVAMFFFLAGMTFRYHEDQRSFLIKIMRRIIVPYFAVGFISICVYRALGLYVAGRLGAHISETTFLDDLGHLLYANSQNGAMKWNESLWFLPCYVCVIFLANAMERMLKYIDDRYHQGLRIVLKIIIPIGGYLTARAVAQNLQQGLPWHWETALLVYPIFDIGRVAKPYCVDNIRIRRQNWLPKICIVSLCGMCSIGISRWFIPISIRTNDFTLWPLTYLYLLLGCVFIWEAAKLLTQVHLPCMRLPLSYTGAHTLGILLWNKFPDIMIQLLLTHVGNNKICAFMETTSWPGIVEAALLAMVCIVLCIAWNRLLSNSKRELQKLISGTEL